MNECREHHWGVDGRCQVCQIKSSYYHSGMATLNTWSKKSKADPSEHWQDLVDSLKCKPHFHDPHHGIVTPEEHFKIHDPFHALYDMEAEQDTHGHWTETF